MAVACSGGTNRSSGSTCRAHRPRLTTLIPYTTTGDTIDHTSSTWSRTPLAIVEPVAVQGEALRTPEGERRRDWWTVHCLPGQRHLGRGKPCAGGRPTRRQWTRAEERPAPCRPWAERTQGGCGAASLAAPRARCCRGSRHPRQPIEGMPYPENLDHHFVVDPAKFDFYAMDC